MVDLAEPVSLYEQNIVKHSSQSPSISTVTTSAYPPTATNSSPAQSLPSYDVTKAPGYSPQNYGPPHPRASDRQYGVNGTGPSAYYGSGLQFGQAPQGPFAPRYNPQFPNSYTASTPNHMPPPEPRGSVDSFRSPQSGTCTRNLIGTLAGTAAKLRDLKNETGVWFVFQDLSIRTEGDFRLKFSFFDIGNTNFDSNESSTTSLALLAPMLACSYSDPFHVYSAKKFPGVIESTALSKEFSLQGVKIPIRKGDAKDGQKSGGKRKRSGDDGSDDSAPGALE
jgi:Velvet factor